MKAISLIQPYATLIMLGYKQFETRGWQTHHRGELAIHASKGKDAWARAVCETNPIIKKLLRAHGLSFDGPGMVRGAILGTVEVREMFPITERLLTRLSSQEIACGDYSIPGRYAWQLDNPKELDNPVDCRGTLQVWQVPEEIARQIIL